MKTLHPAPSVFNLKRLASSLIQIFSSYFMKKNLVSYGNSLKAFFTFSTNMLKVLIDDTTIFLLTPLYWNFNDMLGNKYKVMGVDQGLYQKGWVKYISTKIIQRKV